MNYRCRSSFKLLEMDDQYNLFQPGQVVIDCGAAPGSWSQIAALKAGAQDEGVEHSSGMVISIDRLPIYPIPGATTLGSCDFTKPETQEKIKKLLNGRQVDLILSDMAPNATGIKSMDHEAIIALAYSVIRFALLVSRVGASLVVKVWEGRELINLQKELHRFYKVVRLVKPPASRSDSAEKFVLARDFVGIKR
ncbi:hypothetical protein AAG570_011963 [Ranatra chinensis]|uniref:rRNA methyltransferase 2, mitochondrial n=1 Tax=Ranatra chinensis TaxID=642074 RepID=A0ABD0YTV1_9HEMI